MYIEIGQLQHDSHGVMNLFFDAQWRGKTQEKSESFFNHIVLGIVCNKGVQKNKTDNKENIYKV